MKIALCGWSRDCGANVIVSTDIAASRTRLDNGKYRGGITYVVPKLNGDIEISTGPHNVALHGNYQAKLTLTKVDVMKLFVETFKDVSLNEIIAEIVSAVPAAKLVA